MKRVHSPTSVTDEIDREKKRLVSEKKKKQEGYLVFESIRYIQNKALYLIYKMDLVEGSSGDLIKGAGDSEIRELGQPIASFNLGDLPVRMCIFSFRSKLYFCGGIVRDRDQSERGIKFCCDAYIFDMDTKKGNHIQPMKYPKPRPLVFGPDQNDKIYVFSMADPGSNVIANMEILDTLTNTWESVDLPPNFTKCHYFCKSSLLCGSKILLFLHDNSAVLIFCTISRSWNAIPFIVPFERSHYLFPVKDNGHVLLGSLGLNYPPNELFLLPDLSIPCGQTYEPLGKIKPLGKVEGFSSWFEKKDDFCGTFGIVEGIYFSDTLDSLCVIRSKDSGYIRKDADPKFRGYYQFAIDIYNLNYSGMDDSTKIKAMVENTSQFKYIACNKMSPRHFFFV